MPPSLVPGRVRGASRGGPAVPMLFGVLLYFLFVVAIVALLCVASWRERAFAGVRDAWARTRAWGAAGQARGARARDAGATRAREEGRRVALAVRRRAWPLALAALAIVGLPLGAALLRGVVRVDSFDPMAAHDVDERVAALLQGEQLVPPPPLPPEFFTTPEVAQWLPLPAHASRHWDLLEERFRQRLLLAFKLMRERHGVEMVLVEGWRSPERQAELQALGPTVTRAGPFESQHQWGLAADCAFLRQGRIVISEKDPWAMTAYAQYGEIAQELGLTWGGAWRNLRDLGHVELPRRAPSQAADPVTGRGDNRPPVNH